MSLNSLLFPVAPDRIFDYLLDPTTYPHWLLGADRIRAVDDDWPAPGARFHHRVGVRPMKVEDYTELLEVQRPWMLKLSVHVTVLIRAHVTFRCEGHEGQSILLIEEEPVYRGAGNLVRPVLDPVTHVRNHGSLRRLRTLIEDDADEPAI